MDLDHFLDKVCKEHLPGEMAHRPFVDAAFLYSEYTQWSRFMTLRPVEKSEFCATIEKKFPSTGLVKIGPHPHFIGLSYKTWVPKKA